MTVAMPVCVSSGLVCTSSHQKKQRCPAVHPGLALQSSFLHIFHGQGQQPLADGNQQLSVPQCTASSDKLPGLLCIGGAILSGAKNVSVGWIQCHLLGELCLSFFRMFIPGTQQKHLYLLFLFFFLEWTKQNMQRHSRDLKEKISFSGINPNQTHSGTILLKMLRRVAP